MRIHIFIAAACLTVTSLTLAVPPRAAEPLGEHLAGPETQKWFTAHRPSATFVARNGRMYGMDSDAIVRFLNEQKVEVIELGVAPMTYTGSFSVNEAGVIHLALDKYPAKWPDMFLYSGATGVFLNPTDNDPSFKLGGRGGATETANMVPYWPFRFRTK